MLLINHNEIQEQTCDVVAYQSFLCDGFLFFNFLPGNRVNKIPGLGGHWPFFYCVTQGSHGYPSSSLDGVWWGWWNKKCTQIKLIVLYCLFSKQGAARTKHFPFWCIIYRCLGTSVCISSALVKIFFDWKKKAIQPLNRRTADVKCLYFGFRCV